MIPRTDMICIPSDITYDELTAFALENQYTRYPVYSEKLDNIEKYYLEILLTRGKIELNVSIALLIEHIFIFIKKGLIRPFYYAFVPSTLA